MDNLELWEKVSTTDPAITKHVNQRGGFTAICAQSQLKRATELWGPYGNAWGVRELVWGKFGTENDFDVTLDATFFCPDTSFAISACYKWKVGNDARKKLLTDLTTKALSKLGFNSDVFEGKFDDNKYVQQRKSEEAGNPTHQDTRNESGQQSQSTVTAKNSAVKACAAYSPEDVDAYLAANSDGQAKVFDDLKNDEQFRWLAGKAYGGDIARWIETRGTGGGNGWDPNDDVPF